MVMVMIVFMMVVVVMLLPSRTVMPTFVMLLVRNPLLTTDPLPSPLPPQYAPDWEADDLQWRVWSGRVQRVWPAGILGLVRTNHVHPTTERNSVLRTRRINKIPASVWASCMPCPKVPQLYTQYYRSTVMILTRCLSESDSLLWLQMVSGGFDSFTLELYVLGEYDFWHTNERINSSMNEWMQNEWTNGINQWIDGWVGRLMGEWIKVSSQGKSRGVFAEASRHGSLDQPFGKRRRVVPPTFDKIRVYAILLFISSLQINIFRILLLLRKFIISLGFHSNQINHSNPLQKHHVIYPGMIPYCYEWMDGWMDGWVGGWMDWY